MKGGPQTLSELRAQVESELEKVFSKSRQPSAPGLAKLVLMLKRGMTKKEYQEVVVEDESPKPQWGFPDGGSIVLKLDTLRMATLQEISEWCKVIAEEV